MSALDSAAKMDAQYRFQRYVYDATRKYYLFGRDSILNELSLAKNETLLEVGCGTARNLCILGKQYPHHSLYGVDASQAMLETAASNLKKHRLDGNIITLIQGLAQEITPASFAHNKEPFDHILFSYVLSMIPDWHNAVEQAIKNLKPGGSLHIVDFSDQQTMPAWFRRMLKTWLAWFHVHPDTTLPGYLDTLTKKHGGELHLRHTRGHYALIAHYKKPCE